MPESFEITALPLGLLQANCFIVARGENALVIDPGGGADTVAAALAERGATPCAILLTHGHFDHCGGVTQLVERFAAPVYVGALDAGSGGGAGADGSVFDAAAMGGAVQLRDEQVLKLPIEVTAIPTPGHSPGSFTFALGESDLFVGDLLFRGSIGRTDLPGGNTADLLNSIAGLVRRYPAEAVVHSGHGPSTSLGRELALNPFLSPLRGDPGHRW